MSSLGFNVMVKNPFKAPIGFLTVRQVLLVLGTYWIVGAALLIAWMPTDNTDLDADHRSGVRIVTDYGTSRQYLVTPQGGITPRLPRAVTP